MQATYDTCITICRQRESYIQLVQRHEDTIHVINTSRVKRIVVPVLN